jgi:monovalent cation/hydrogen antiporter
VFGLEVIVVLGAAVLICGVASDRMRIAPPVLLLAAGALAGFVPALRAVELPPDVMLLLFLPALLYWESLTTSLREIRSNLRVIVLQSTVLVVATAGAVALVAHALGLGWGPAWVLGAAVAPTDATAVGAVARGLPRRMVTTLRAESLVNDGMALVIYGLAVGVTVGEQRLSAGTVSWLTVLAYGGGAAAGVVTAWLAVQTHRRLTRPLLANAASLLTPFVAFLLAEVAHASGVLAVVVCGLALSRFEPRLVQAETRTQAIAFWTLATYLLNGSLFVLIGLQAQVAVRGLTGSLGTAALLALAVSGTVIGVRFAWLFTTPYLIRAVDRRPAQRLRRAGPRPRVVSGVSGFRGAVSLAAALGVPVVLRSGTPFPDRDLVIFATCGVVVVTLVVQGLLLPHVVRWARLGPDDEVARERRLAQVTASEEAWAALPDLAVQLGTSDAVLARVRKESEKHVAELHAGVDGVEAIRFRTAHDQYVALRLALIAQKRGTAIRLRDEGRIDDVVLRQVESGLDIEEIRLHRIDPDRQPFTD